MGLVQNIVIFVLVVSFFTFVAFFGRLPAFRHTPIGSLHRFLWIGIPNFFGALDRLFTGGRLSPGLRGCGNYLFYSKHPIVMIIFLGLLTGSAAMFLPPTWPLLSTGQKFLVFIVLPPPYIFTYLCQASKPTSLHLISPANIREQLQQYPFDHILYHPNNICKTCELPKPARSKHCSLCGTCVARCDHHCVWVNNCVGRGNYKHFLGLLLSCTITLLYGTYLAYTTLMPEIYWRFEHQASWYLSALSGSDDWLSRILDKFTYGLDIFQTALVIGGLRRAGVGLLAAMTWPLPLGLLGYHVYLIYAGMSTNETSKWDEWKEDMADGYVFVADIKEEARSSVARWPHGSRQFLVRTSDGKRPRGVADVIGELVVEGSWEQVWHLADVENVYDLGVWGNLAEVLRN